MSLNPVTKVHSNWSAIIILMMLYFQSGHLGHSTSTIILKSSEHKSHAWVFGVICTFQSSQFFDRLSMHFGVVDHIRTSALTTTDRRPPSWNWITDSTNAPPVGNVGGRTPLGLWASDRPWTAVFHFFRFFLITALHIIPLWQFFSIYNYGLHEILTSIKLL